MRVFRENGYKTIISHSDAVVFTVPGKSGISLHETTQEKAANEKLKSFKNKTGKNLRK